MAIIGALWMRKFSERGISPPNLWAKIKNADEMVSSAFCAKDC
jgi:hypothetical protein